MKSQHAFLALLALSSGASPVFAQDSATAPLCTDRPTKSNATCTVPEGSWQVESDLPNVTRNDDGGVRTTTTYAINPYLKYGIDDHQDIEVNWAPQVRVRTDDGTARHTIDGAGDVFVRYKVRFFSNDTVAIALLPYIKAPTANHDIGNRRWEGGVIVPISITLPNKFTLVLGPEVDALADSSGTGRHAAYTNLVNLSRPISDRLGIAVEYWTQDNHDPAGTIRQRSADVALTVAATSTLQFDVGANFGLNDATPDRQIYLGFSTRF
ncbi:transporter [Pinirhizobacter sp.]|jgi:hypothetical protein|uniref:transporter n=1 Tax=Pinirhizobacter sp. TaxID=2950432 RepID=UPI002F3E80DD